MLLAAGVETVSLDFPLIGASEPCTILAIRQPGSMPPSTL